MVYFTLSLSTGPLFVEIIATIIITVAFDHWLRLTASSLIVPGELPVSYLVPFIPLSKALIGSCGSPSESSALSSHCHPSQYLPSGALALPGLMNWPLKMF
jgi:hypothetical protein